MMDDDDDDMMLLREFAASKSEQAFTELVTRHVDLVHSVALRQVRDVHLAQEITQVVFIILARKASTLGPKTILSGWLCRTARYAASNALTIQRRRRLREQEAHMQSTLNEAGSNHWEQIAPLLDEAMANLGDKDHDALVLRYFEGKSFKDLASATETSEDAAKMRVSRALEKLRKFFSKRGVVLSATVIAAAISANSVSAAPLNLTATITATVLKGSAVAASTTALVKGTLKLMAWLKAKTLIVVSAGTIVAGATALTLQERMIQNYNEEKQIRAEEKQIAAQEQQIRTEEQRPETTADQKKQLEEKLSQLRKRHDELKAKQDELRASQQVLRAQDPRPTAPAKQASPFTRMRFKDGGILVTYLGDEYKLGAINGVTAPDLMAFAAAKYGKDMSEKRIAEDLVMVLQDIGHPVNQEHTVSLSLIVIKSGEKKNVDRALMTKENRRAVFEDLHAGP
jgi:RNA polymerase sigma factor (sigma-70 family)